jgi:hypothetical protein
MGTGIVFNFFQRQTEFQNLLIQPGQRQDVNVEEASVGTSKHFMDDQKT